MEDSLKSSGGGGGRQWLYEGKGGGGVALTIRKKIKMFYSVHVTKSPNQIECTFNKIGRGKNRKEKEKGKMGGGKGGDFRVAYQPLK